MNLRPLGRSGISIAPLMLGGNVFGWNVDQETSVAILDAFVDAGFNAVDTADSYSRWAPGHVGGESETVIGRWLKESGKRDKVVIATKVGADMGEGKMRAEGLHPARLRGLAAAARRRDHRSLPDAFRRRGDAGRGDAGGLRELIGDGKVRAIGASNIVAGAAEGLVRRQPKGRPARATRACSRSTTRRPQGIRDRLSRRSPRRGPRRHPLLLPRRRFPHRQVPLGRRGRRQSRRAAAG